ncbi:hypothetical protein H4R19_005447 [Coemansia spiralis]|nr:hypothetical protein H4R19_005447 [Coemansia spiralis]
MQALIFILKRQWQHIGWMIVYLLAIPFFTFLLPVYSFWRFDDFSWGNTRVVVGESGRKHVYLVDNEKFDTSTIPVRKWSDYEQELMWEAGTPSQYGSELGSRHGALSAARPGSAVGNYPKSMGNPFAAAGGGYASSNTASVYMDGAGGGFGYNSASGANIAIHGSGVGGMPMMPHIPGTAPMSGRATPVMRSPPHPQVYTADAYDVMAYAASSPPPAAPDHLAGFPAVPMGMPPAYDPRLSQLLPPQSYRGVSPAPGMLMDGYTMSAPYGAPRAVSDDQIGAHIAAIIAGGDLMAMSKKQVREQAARDLGLSPEEAKARQPWMNACIAAELAKRTGA